MQWMQGAMMLETAYFSYNPTHTSKDFWQRLRMNKELVMKIFIGVS
jgi:hypothetical protein